MRRFVSAFLLFAIMSSVPENVWAEKSDSVAMGDEPSPTRIDASDNTKSQGLGHKHQFGLGLRMGSGFRMIVPYNEEFCGQAGRTLCRERYPLYIEVSPSFGITSALELLLDTRFFLEEPTYASATGQYFAPGFKYYADANSRLKFFLTAQLVFETQKQRPDDALKSFDFGLRSAMGVQFDLMRYVGLFFQPGLVFGFTRWFTFVADLSAGVQVRY